MGNTLATASTTSGWSLLLDLPIELLPHIFQYSNAHDLLAISATCWRARSVLLHRTADTERIWLNAVRGYGLPDPPPHISTPHYVFLLFGTTCTNCGGVWNVPFDSWTIDRYLGQRWCGRCRSRLSSDNWTALRKALDGTEFYANNGQTRYFYDVLPHYKILAATSEWDRCVPRIKACLYYVRDMQCLLDALKDCDIMEKDAILEQQVAYTRALEKLQPISSDKDLELVKNIRTAARSDRLDQLLLTI